MKIPVREQKQPRQCIVKALFELLEHKSYHDITIGRLAQKANISRRTFYRCFQTKDDVMKYTLAEKFEVSVRTIYRDIDAMSSAGIPIYVTAGRNGGIRFLDGHILDKTFFSSGEKQDLPIG